MSRYENNAQCFFLYALLIVANIIASMGIYGVGDYLLSYHALFPENLWIYKGLKKDISLLILGIPFFYLLLYFIQRSLNNNNFSVENIFRKWALYAGISLFALIVFYGLSCLFHELLEQRFILSKALKYAWLAFIALLFLSYALIEVSKNHKNLTKIQKVLILFIGVISIGLSMHGLKYDRKNMRSEEFNRLVKKEEAQLKENRKKMQDVD